MDTDSDGTTRKSRNLQSVIFKEYGNNLSVMLVRKVLSQVSVPLVMYVKSVHPVLMNFRLRSTSAPRKELTKLVSSVSLTAKTIRRCVRLLYGFVRVNYESAP